MIFQNYEILGAIFLLIMMYLTFIAFKKKHISKPIMFVWLAIWVAGFIAMVFKDYVFKLLPALSVYRIFDLYTIIGFMFFLFMIFYLFSKLKQSQKKLEKLARYIAMNNADMDLQKE